MKKQTDPDVIASHKSPYVIETLTQILNETREFDVDFVEKGKKYYIICESKLINDEELDSAKVFCSAWIDGWDSAMEHSMEGQAILDE